MSVRNGKPQIAQFLWVKGALSVMEQACLQSFLNHGYEVHLYHYEDVTGVPAGVSLHDGEEILPRDSVFQSAALSKPSYAGFSDLFRYHLLFKKGGWWFDMDFISIKQQTEPESLLFASTWEGEFGQLPMGCAIFAKQGDPVIAELCDRADAIVSSQEVDFGSIGPRLIQAIVREKNLEKHVAPWYEFCPYPWRMVSRLVHDDFYQCCAEQLRAMKQFVHEIVDPNFKAGRIRAGTRALHLHNEIWKKNGVDKNKTYFRLCKWERMKKEIFDAVGGVP